MSSTWVSILSAGLGLITGLLTYLGMRLSQRQAVKAQEVTSEIERSKADSQAYTEARQTWDSLIRDLRNQVKDQRTDLAEMRGKLTAQNKVAGEFHTRLEDMEQKRRGDRVAIHVLTEYARQLLWVLRENNIQPPPTPEGLDMDR